MFKKILLTLSLFALSLSAFAADNPQVRIVTNKGNIEIELNKNKAPISVDNFLQYVKSDYYNGTVFHRIIKGFMIQGGGFTKDFKRKEVNTAIQNEAFNGLKNERGTIAMARTGQPHSATAQFFINTVNNRSLNHSGKSQRGWGYAVFGKVTKGLDVVDSIENSKTGARKIFRGDVPVEDIIIQKVEVINELALHSASVFEPTDVLTKKRDVDPNGYFTILPPAKWEILKYPNEQRGKVGFLTSNNLVSLRVLAAPVDFNSIDDLISGAKKIEKRIGKSTNITKTNFYGRSAMRRSFVFNGSKLLSYDFLVGNIHHNIQYGAPPRDFPKFSSLVEKSIETYDPLARSASSKDVTEAALAGKRRIAEIAIKFGNIELAKEYIKEGLDINSTDSKLLQLHSRIDKLRNN